MGVRLRTSLNNGLNNGLRQSISGGVGAALAFLEYTTASVSTFRIKTIGTVNYDVDWGDGSSDTGVTTNTKDHTYSSAGVYVIKITPAGGSTFRPEHYNSVDYQTNLTKVDGTGGSSFNTNLTNWLRETASLTSFGSSIDLSHVTNLQAAWRQCTGLASFPSTDVSSCTTFANTWDGCTGLTSFGLINTSSATNIRSAWLNCSGITTFPLIDTSSVTNPRDAWNGCSGLTSFPALDLSSGTDFRGAWLGCSGITSFPSITPTSATDFGGAWRDCSSLTTYPANQFDTTGTLTSGSFSTTFSNCALTAQSIENIFTSLDTNGAQNVTLQIGGGTNANASTWSYDALDAYVDLINKGWTINQNGTPGIAYTISNSGTSFTLRSVGTVNYTVDWGDGSALETSTSNTLAHTYSSSGTYVVKINNNSGATYTPRFNDSGDEDQIVSVAIAGAGSITGLDFTLAFRGSANMTSYKQVFNVTSSITSLDFSFDGCSSLTSFPAINTSSITTYNSTWKNCTNMASFATTDFSSATSVRRAWQNCTSLTSFPAVDFSSLNTAIEAWYNCSSLTDYPANQFDTTGTLSSNAFTGAFYQCALTAQSIENILTSLDTNGAQNITLSLNFGTNAGKSTWSSAANTAYNNLITKGWTISFNS